jgi:hypothetical protein
MFRKIHFAAVLAFPLIGVLNAETIEIKIQASNGKNGKPLSKQRLIIFSGESAEAASSHQRHFESTTDGGGRVELKIDRAKDLWIQVWVDGFTLCQNKPNLQSFNVNAIVTTGMSAPNNCSSAAVATTPGQLEIFARASTFQEKMQH